MFLTMPAPILTPPSGQGIIVSSSQQSNWVVSLSDRTHSPLSGGTIPMARAFHLPQILISSSLHTPGKVTVLDLLGLTTGVAETLQTCIQMVGEAR